MKRGGLISGLGGVAFGALVVAAFIVIGLWLIVTGGPHGAPVEGAQT